jgi:hypothetical protein
MITVMGATGHTGKKITESLLSAVCTADVRVAQAGAAIKTSETDRA